MDLSVDPAQNPMLPDASCRLPTAWGEFTLHGYRDARTGREHVALQMGRVDDGRPVLARVHSQCLTGETLGSARCDCGFQLEAALERIRAEGRGVLVYLRQEGRGIGLLNKIRAYALQDAGHDTVDANLRLGLPVDARDYAVAAELLRGLGVESVRLMTNNPRKVRALEEGGVAVAGRIALQAPVTAHNARYLRTKAARLGQLLDLPEPGNPVPRVAAPRPRRATPCANPGE